jgi:hypothetical protein
MARAWSEGESAQLRRLVQEGAVDAEIAMELGRARETINRKRRMLGLAPGGSPAYRAALLRRAVQDASREENLASRPTTYTQELGQEFCRRLSEGLSFRRVLRDPDMPTRETVRRWQSEQPEFAAGYRGAREDLIEALAEDALDRAGDAASTLDVARSKGFLIAVKYVGGLLAPRNAPARPNPSPGPTRHSADFGDALELALERARMRENGAGPTDSGP